MNYAAARHNMVESQIRTNRVTDPRLIEALEEVPRERFVPTAFQGVAYVDGDISLGQGRALLEPMIIARLLQAAAVKDSDLVLDVGSATGYAAAVLARQASSVVALESDTALSAQAAATLNELGADNVVTVNAPLADGDAAHAPYDVIVLEGRVSRIPGELLNQLADGGRLVAVVTTESGAGRATLMLRIGNTFSQRLLFDARPAVLPGFEAAPEFMF